MELSLNSLKDAGAFAGAPVEKEIKWTQDDKELCVTAYIRRDSYRSTVASVMARGDDAIAGRIASCICDKNGSPVFSVSDITGTAVIYDNDSDDEKKRKKEIVERGPISNALTIALLTAIAEVNGISDKKKRTRGKRTNRRR